MILEIIIGFFVVILSLMIFILSYKKLTKQKLNFNIKKVCAFTVTHTITSLTVEIKHLYL